MSNLKTLQRSKEFGKFVMNFANATSTDEACHQIIEGAQYAFNLSANFSKKAIKAFPHIDEITSLLTKQEKALLDYFCEESDLVASISEEFRLLNLELENYNCQKKTLTFWEETYSEARSKGDVDSKPTYSGPITKHIDDIAEAFIGFMSPDTPKEVKNLMEVGLEIQKLKNRILEEKYNEIKNLSEFYLKFHSPYESIRERKDQLKKILHDLVNGMALSKNEQIGNFLQDYNSFCNPRLKLNSDNSISYETKFFKETDFFEIDRGPNVISYSWPRPYHATILYFLFEFFKHPDNIKLIHLCDECTKFYISKSLRPSKFCSNKCKNAYHNRKRIESGKSRDYKRKKRMEGAKESYYG